MWVPAGFLEVSADVNPLAQHAVCRRSESFLDDGQSSLPCGPMVHHIGGLGNRVSVAPN
ncbi:UNVERIFIED_CONTAM: hypothetical protein FKN15_054812 [Acipenser sinensis]